MMNVAAHSDRGAESGGADCSTATATFHPPTPPPMYALTLGHMQVNINNSIDIEKYFVF